MTIVRAAEATIHDIHGARFHAYAHSGTGAAELAAWTTEVRPGVTGAAHIVDREEVLRVMSGRLRLVLNGEEAELEPGDVAIVPAGAQLRVDNLGDGPATLWATTRLGLSATMADGSRLSPPWAR